MTRRSRIDLRSLITAMMLSFVAQESTAMNQAPSTPTPIPCTLEELARTLPVPMPTTVEKIETLLGIKLHVKDDNPYGVYYDSGPLVTRDRHIITSVDARLAKPGSDRWQAGDAHVFLLAFTLDSSACVPLKPMHDIMGLGKPTSISVPAPWGETDYSRITEWGSVGLAVNNATPNCVKSFGVSTFKEQPSLPQ